MTEKGSYGARIRVSRELRKMSQADFAELAGVTARAQRNYEAGLRVPNISYLENLASHGVDVRYILTGQESPYRQWVDYVPAFHWLAERVGIDEATRDEIVGAFEPLNAPGSKGLPDYAREALQRISSEHAIGQIEATLLGNILEAIDRIAPTLTVRKKAGIASLLYRTSRLTSWEIDPRAVKEAVELAS